MTTPLPSRLRESAQAMRGLSPCSEHSYELLDVVAWNIAAELSEAADALEAQREDRREVLRILYEAHRKTNPSPSLAAISAAIQHLQAVEDASAQVAQEGAAGVATRTVPVELLQRAIAALGKTNARDVWCDLRDATGVATDTPAVCRLCLAVTGGRQCFEPACPGGVATDGGTKR